VADFSNREPKGTKMKYLSVIGIMLLTGVVMAQSASPSPAFSLPNSSIADWISSHMASIVMYGGLALSEVAMRLFPSGQPLSWLYAVSAVFKWAAQLASTVAQALDGILGQNVSK
jgi:hypothetical protein